MSVPSQSAVNMGNSSSINLVSNNFLLGLVHLRNLYPPKQIIFGKFQTAVDADPKLGSPTPPSFFWDKCLISKELRQNFWRYLKLVSNKKEIIRFGGYRLPLSFTTRYISREMVIDHFAQLGKIPFSKEEHTFCAPLYWMKMGQI